MVSVNAHDPERQEIVSRRTVLLGGGVSLFFAGIGARLYQLQIAEHQKYRDLAQNNQFNKRILTPLRGEIVDRFGEPLASNRKNFRILLVPEQARDVDAALDKISKITPVSEDKRARIMREIRRRGAFTPVQIADNLSWEDFSKINFELPHLAGVLPDVGETRDYPHGAEAAFVIGYVGAVTERDLAAQESDDERILLRQPGFKVGREGLERTYEKELRGAAGAMNVKINAHGRVIEEMVDSAVPPVQGKTLALTIDSDLQAHAMKVLSVPGERMPDEPQSAAAVVIDVVTGDILVLASTPAFNPNDFNVGIDPQLWKELNESPYKPLLNKPLSGVYPPGSTFKVISAIAAQRAGMKPSETAYCPGRVWYGNRYFHCWKRGGHGTLDMKGAIKHSCDVYFYEIAKTLDIDLLAETARDFGLGQTYELGISGQQRGVIPDRDWKKQYFAGNPAQQPWFQGETLSCIIGQGYVTSTPLQLAVMAARVATGRAVRPRLVRAVGDLVLPAPEAAPIDVDHDYLSVVHAGMNAVTNEWGTAARSRIEDPDWQMAGKTGTSQVYQITAEDRARGLDKPEDLPWARRDHALFVSYMPYENPRYACSVVVEHGIGGSRAAGPKARDIMKAVAEKDPASRTPLDPRTLARAPSPRES
ncbi:penicillin-binding protein 2 [Hyphococcus luteus]|uniref:Penicillin-binding protein 2 n=1 Tax=Hyphococcus luteus TaxID=2058213 RepID=A0A2S7K4D1_9PROT|nr:penicillin-binding protein 2 [Marinicaulis flavus]PQA87341.1 penicillin-binding protein 2 [Marinicaulis flavus]